MTQHTIAPELTTVPNGAASKPKPKKPLRFKIGVGLLIFYPFMYLIIPISAFLPIEVGFKVGLVAGVLGAAEGVLLLAIACVGKEAFQAIKAKLGLGKKKRAEQEAARLAAEEPAAASPTADTPENPKDRDA